MRPVGRQGHRRAAVERAAQRRLGRGERGAVEAQPERRPQHLVGGRPAGLGRRGELGLVVGRRAELRARRQVAAGVEQVEVVEPRVLAVEVRGPGRRGRRRSRARRGRRGRPGSAPGGRCSRRAARAGCRRPRPATATTKRIPITVAARAARRARARRGHQHEDDPEVLVAGGVGAAEVARVDARSGARRRRRSRARPRARAAPAAGPRRCATASTTEAASSALPPLQRAVVGGGEAEQRGERGREAVEDERRRRREVVERELVRRPSWPQPSHQSAYRTMGISGTQSEPPQPAGRARASPPTPATNASPIVWKREPEDQQRAAQQRVARPAALEHEQRRRSRRRPGRRSRPGTGSAGPRRPRPERAAAACRRARARRRPRRRIHTKRSTTLSQKDERSRRSRTASPSSSRTSPGSPCRARPGASRDGPACGWRKTSKLSPRRCRSTSQSSMKNVSVELSTTRSTAGDRGREPEQDQWQPRIVEPRRGAPSRRARGAAPAPSRRSCSRLRAPQTETRPWPASESCHGWRERSVGIASRTGWPWASLPSSTGNSSVA